MGWDTQIVIIAENIRDEEEVIFRALYEKDAKDYIHNGISFAKVKHLNDQSKVLFFTYERRKYLPYWIIQEVSVIYKDVYFTVAARCPDFIGGPAGIIKVSNGEITDSYGFWGERREMLENPDPELIYNWFAMDKQEERFRKLYSTSRPKKWIEELYSENIFELSPLQEAVLHEYRQSNKTMPDNWEDMPLP
ncbi:MAG: hypothetical protein K0S33_1399 [Bacteroidetes bacterium]|jgi:hypothetical protein|nr:hypothetical protein [Bacteroidota bacterium]